MSLQYPRADHRETVQPNLRREHDDERSKRVGATRAVGLGKRAGEQARAGEHCQPSRRQHEQGPRHQRRGCTRGLLTPARPDVPRHDRNNYAGQYAAGHDLEEHVGQTVCGVVGVAEAGVTDRLGEDQGPPEPDKPRSERQACDTRGHGCKTGSHVGSLAGVAVTRTGRPS